MLEVGLLAGCMMFSFLGAPVFLELVLSVLGGAGSEPPPSKVPFKGLEGSLPGGDEGEKGLKPP